MIYKCRDLYYIEVYSPSGVASCMRRDFIKVHNTNYADLYLLVWIDTMLAHVYLHKHKYFLYDNKLL